MGKARAGEEFVDLEERNISRAGLEREDGGTGREPAFTGAGLAAHGEQEEGGGKGQGTRAQGAIGRRRGQTRDARAAGVRSLAMSCAGMHGRKPIRLAHRCAAGGSP